MVSSWLAQNDIIRPEDGSNAEVVAAINNWLEAARQRQRNPQLVDEISRDLQARWYPPDQTNPKPGPSAR